ncbi:MAG: hypothetical protein JSW33_04990, partial [bacterium]
MRKKLRTKRCKFLKILLSVLLCFFWVYTSGGLAQSEIGFNNEVYKLRVLQKIDSLVEAKYVYPQKAKLFAQEFRKTYEGGSYISFTDMREFAGQVTADLIRITQDKHFNFRVIEPTDVGEEPQGSLHHPIRYHRLGIKENNGFFKLEWLEGNIACLDFRRFYYFTDTRDLMNAAMKFMSNANSIIIDLRENGGGSGEYLSSYFLVYPTQLNSWYSREDDFLTEYWTIKEIGVERCTDVPLFILTSKRTFSAAESFAYDMKVRKRAVIIGDSTKGGAHSVDLYKIDDLFEIYIPTSRAINPVTGTNWEGKGVIPDIIIPAELALDTAIVMAKKAAEEYAQAKETKLTSAIKTMQLHMDNAETLFRENQNTGAESALNSVFQIAIQHDLVNVFFIDVLAYNYYSLKDEQILYAILKKKVELFPKSSAGYESLGYAYYKNNRIPQALTSFEKVLELDPD